MTEIIRITPGEIETLIPRIGRIQKNAEKMTRIAMGRWGRMIPLDLKMAAKQAGVEPSSGGLFGPGIRYEQHGNIGLVKMYQYGIWLDRMKPHWVSIHNRRLRLLRWALMARSDSIRKRAKLVSSGKLRRFCIKVKPHQYIKTGYARSLSKLRPMLKSAAKNAVKNRR